jgi:hypothetical protein
MKNTAIALTFATLLLAGTPVLAANPVEPGAPGSDKAPGVTPSDASSAETIVVVAAPDVRKNTGASNPDTPDPTRNTPGAGQRTDLRDRLALVCLRAQALYLDDGAWPPTNGSSG